MIDFQILLQYIHEAQIHKFILDLIRQSRTIMCQKGLYSIFGAIVAGRGFQFLLQIREQFLPVPLDPEIVIRILYTVAHPSVQQICGQQIPEVPPDQPAGSSLPCEDFIGKVIAEIHHAGISGGIPQDQAIVKSHFGLQLSDISQKRCEPDPGAIILLRHRKPRSTGGGIFRMTRC